MILQGQKNLFCCCTRMLQEGCGTCIWGDVSSLSHHCKSLSTMGLKVHSNIFMACVLLHIIILYDKTLDPFKLVKDIQIKRSNCLLLILGKAHKTKNTYLHHCLRNDPIENLFAKTIIIHENKEQLFLAIPFFVI
jgi:hypothetical protein